MAAQRAIRKFRDQHLSGYSGVIRAKRQLGQVDGQPEQQRCYFHTLRRYRIGVAAIWLW